MFVKVVFVLSCVAVCFSAPPAPVPEGRSLSISVVPIADARSKKDFIPIVSQESDVDVEGKYHFSYESGDGSKAAQAGELKVLDKDHVGPSVVGEFSYKGTDGKDYRLTYTADENGFRPDADFLPVGPPVPGPIARALVYLATAPPPKEEVSIGKH